MLLFVFVVDVVLKVDIFLESENTFLRQSGIKLCLFVPIAQQRHFGKGGTDESKFWLCESDHTN